MQTKFRPLLLVLAATIAVVCSASAQTRPSDSTARAATADRPSSVLFAVVGGPGVETPTPFFFESNGDTYQTQKRPMVFELEVSRTLLATRGRKTFFEYFVAVQPAVTIGGNVKYLFRPCMQVACFRSGVDLVEQRYTSYGIGATPFGARVTTSLPLGMRLSAMVGAGAVLLSRPVPYDKAKRLNFQLMARPAIGIPLRNHGTLWAGYQALHISNANTSAINPGINAGLVMFGYQRGR
jgi:hypothetical protein